MQKETLGGDRYYLDCGDSLTGLYIYSIVHQIVHIKFVHFFVYQLYFNKAVKK